MAGFNPLQLVQFTNQNGQGANALQIAQQQQLAQALMDQGSQPDDTAQLANPGGLVVPLNKWALAAKALEKGAGGYEQGQASQKQMALMQALSGPSQSDVMGAATNAAIGNGEGPAPMNAVADNYKQIASQLAQQKPQGIMGMPSVSGNAGTDMAMSQMFPDAFNKALGDKLIAHGYKPGETIVNPNGTTSYAADPTAGMQLVAGPNGTPVAVPIQGAAGIMGGMAGAKSGAEAAAQYPYQAGLQANKAAITPYQQQAMVNGQPVMTTSNDLAAATGQIPPVLRGGNPNAMSPQGNGGPVSLTPPGSAPPAAASPPPPAATLPAPEPSVSLAVPVGAVKQAESQGAAQGADIGAAEKGMSAIDSRVQTALNTMDELKGLAKVAPSGSGADADVWLSRNVGHGIDEANFNSFKTKNANLLTSELPGIIQATGGRMDIPLFNAIKAASAVDEYSSPTAKLKVIDDLKEALVNYQKNSHNNYQQLSGNASPVPPIPQMPSIRGDADHSALPPGTIYMAPDGTQRRKQ